MTTNGHRAIPIDLGEKNYLLRYDFNALVALEEALGTTKIDFDHLGFRGQRALLWAGLAHDTEKDLTLAEVGKILDPYLKDTKRYGEIMETAMKALQSMCEPPNHEPDSKNVAATAGPGTYSSVGPVA